MRNLISILLVISLTTSFGQQQKQITFKKSDYPISRFTLRTIASNFGQVKIITTTVSPKASSDSFLCRSWLIIQKNDKILTRKFYDIDPVGGCSGLFFPPTQLLDNYFILSKFGDYDGETLLVDKTGKLIVLAGGSFSISADKKYIFSVWDSDLSGITIFDLTSGKTILSRDIEGDKRYGDFYFQDGKYYISYVEDNTVGEIDLHNKKIIASKKKSGFLKQTNKLKIYNGVQTLPKCNCGS
ncbi:hypothetical protein [Paludibacter sp.]|uniref:hypothetical protein n=1 Tax=Paludibacter sp. TaxID=1898105 RepID=UPI0013521EA9|nr:hypothetical protein [Paludibacter sp.]MTK53860.1 hypothetical protein [Paludibacter sp.]